MANIKSQIKRNRQNEKRRVRNKAVRSELKTRTKAADHRRRAGRATNAEALTRLAIKRIDKAATKGVIHKNQAARRKSRLVKQLANAGQLTAARPRAEPAISTAAGSSVAASRASRPACRQRRGQAGHQHLQSPARSRPRLARPAGRGRPRPAARSTRASRSGPSRRLWASAFLAGKVEPFMPSSSAACLLVGHARRRRGAASGRSGCAASPSPAAGARPAPRSCGAARSSAPADVAPVDGVGEVPRRHAAGLAEERLDVVGAELARRRRRRAASVVEQAHAAGRRPRPAGRRAAPARRASSLTGAPASCSSSHCVARLPGAGPVSTTTPPAALTASISFFGTRAERGARLGRPAPTPAPARCVGSGSAR